MLPIDKSNSEQNDVTSDNAVDVPPILTLRADEFDEIFDYLTIYEMIAVANTCKSLYTLQRMNYKSDLQMNHFSNYIR